ncbi:MAG: hypothetical protein F6K14_23875, partial [Symploca sp. SIO2C1]|nr:hypothetical protein [Symploca sp. SIO2C1]
MSEETFVKSLYSVTPDFWLLTRCFFRATVNFTSPGLTDSRFPIPNSRFPIPNSQFPIPNSQFPIPNSQFPIPNSLIVIITLQEEGRRQEAEGRRLKRKLTCFSSSFSTWNFSLLPTPCSLRRQTLITHYSLLITHYSLLITHYSLLITHYSLLITHYSLLITHYSL